MVNSTRHPLYAKADALKCAFLLNDFSLADDGQAPEAETSDWDFCAFQKPAAIKRKSIILTEGNYILRSELITSQLDKLKSPLPIKKIVYGRIYDGNDSCYPCRTLIEGIVADRSMDKKEYGRLWDSVVKQVYGIFAETSLVAIDNDTYQVKVQLEDDSLIMAYTGKATNVARTLLGITTADTDTWVFSIDIDDVTIHDCHLESRKELYNPTVSFLKKYEGISPVLGNSFAGKAADLLRKHGYMEFSGLKIYESDCYKKMNMIQESWDRNNNGVQLKEPLGKYTGLPTVLTPALEEALAANYKAGEKSVKLFEIGHIFPHNAKGHLSEKLSLSLGAYGPDVNKTSFRKSMDDFLTELGIRNHFFIPTFLAIAYNTKDCWLILDETMSYLEGNFGSISQKALDNHGIGVQAFMLQLELAPAEAKAAREWAFTPPELT